MLASDSYDEDECAYMVGGNGNPQSSQTPKTQITAPTQAFLGINIQYPSSSTTKKAR